MDFDYFLDFFSSMGNTNNYKFGFFFAFIIGTISTLYKKGFLKLNFIEDLKIRKKYKNELLSLKQVGVLNDLKLLLIFKNLSEKKRIALYFFSNLIIDLFKNFYRKTIENIDNENEIIIKNIYYSDCLTEITSYVLENFQQEFEKFIKKKNINIFENQTEFDKFTIKFIYVIEEFTAPFAEALMKDVNSLLNNFDTEKKNINRYKLTFLILERYNYNIEMYLKFLISTSKLLNGSLEK